MTAPHLIVALLALAALVAITGGIIWWLSRDEDDPDQFDRELDALRGWTDETPLPLLPPEDMAGPDEDAGAGLAPLPSDVPAVVAVGPAVRLTGPQRRRAARKGRVPRDLPGRGGAEVRDSAPAGEHHPTELEKLAHEAHEWLIAEAERLMRADYYTFWSDLDRQAREAYAAAGAGFADLERIDWLVAA